jgi:hypothetical protein
VRSTRRCNTQVKVVQHYTTSDFGKRKWLACE